MTEFWFNLAWYSGGIGFLWLLGWLVIRIPILLWLFKIAFLLIITFATPAITLTVVVSQLMQGHYFTGLMGLVVGGFMSIFGVHMWPEIVRTFKDLPLYASLWDPSFTKWPN